MAEAFTAGVRPGGLTDDTQIRMLLCYLVKVAGPVKHETLQGALLQEQLVNYFEFADALAEVEKQKLVTVDSEGRYTITRKGATVADTLAYDLPRTVRESAIRAVMQIRSWNHRAASNRARVIVHTASGPLDAHQIGRVCMDQTMLDVTDIPDVKLGSEVIVFGGRELPMELVAEWADTICYEIICDVSPRVPREYVRGN